MSSIARHTRLALATALFVAALFAAPTLAHGREGGAARTFAPRANFGAELRPASMMRHGARGSVLFLQPVDAEKIAYVLVIVRRLAADHAYAFQRATDPLVDDDCTGTNWLTLGEGLVPQAVVTDRHGNGWALLFRDLAAIPVGTALDIRFRLIDMDDSAVVLQSACNQFVVTQ